MPGSLAGLLGRNPAVSTDTLALAIAAALHVVLLVWLPGESQARSTGVSLLDVPELNVALDPPESLPVGEAGTDETSEDEAPNDPEVRAPQPSPRPAAPVQERPAPEPTPSDSPAADPFDNVLASDADGRVAFPVSERASDREAKKTTTRSERAGGKRRVRRLGRPTDPRYPPALHSVVNRNYPRYARAEGVEGTVEAHVRLSDTGRVLHVRVASVTDDGWGFGEACTRSIHQLPVWKPKLDARGKPVPTLTRFFCRFVLPKR